jgi:hypothetical protein
VGAQGASSSQGEMMKVRIKHAYPRFYECLRLGYKYYNNVREYKHRFPNFPIIRYALQYSLKYFWCMTTKHNTLEDAIPWLTYPAIAFLNTFLTNDMRVYEFGTGGSTLFFAKRVKEVFSVEHDRPFHDTLITALANQNITNAHVQLIEPKPVPNFSSLSPKIPEDYISADEAYASKDFKDYASSIDIYDDNSFDVILIDGRARNSCFQHAVPKLKQGGILIIDNSSRDHYQYMHASIAKLGWKQLFFPGPLPHSERFSHTLICVSSDPLPIG